MINPEVLLSDLEKLLGQVEDDLRERADELPEVGESLRSGYDRAKQAERTAQPFETWREEYLTQVAAAWVIACVFVRFIEDNGLIEGPLLAGSGPRLDQAKDERTLYFQQHPTDSDREYLDHVFRKVEALPAAAPLFDARHNPLWTFGVSGDGATLLIEFWQRIDPATGALAHDFADLALNTRFLGDLYQDLSEAARKKYALLQTPEFVEEFILDRTLTPAMAEFGLAATRLIDPACGSGHFLLGAFHRLLAEWQKREPSVNVRELVQRSLHAVSGVDLNPYATAIARFRLLIAALKASDVHRLADAPAFHMNLATGDSLLHGPRPGGERQTYLEAEADPLRHVYDTEDAEQLLRILGARYHAVVGNPPYITVKDSALNEAYRRRFGSCHMRYSLAVPFMERFFDLAVSSGESDEAPAGYVGTITSNSFMKREFGKKLIEEYIPRWNLTHVIDLSGAYIPGHGTPTVILFGTHRKPVHNTIRAALGIRGEPQTPSDPSRGLVWSAVLGQIDIPGSRSAFISVADISRKLFHSHPWSIGGGGATELRTVLEERGVKTLEDISESIGFMVIIGEDDALLLPEHIAQRAGLPWRPFVTGEQIRDWSVEQVAAVVFPYQETQKLPVLPLEGHETMGQYLWPLRTVLANRSMFGKSPAEYGFQWDQYLQFIRNRAGAQRLIAFAFVASHNHFVLDRGGSVFNRSAPVIKLWSNATDEDYLALLGLLNSSTACFWMKQVSQQKQLTGGDGVRVESVAKVPYEFAGTQLAELPLPRPFFEGQLRERLIALAGQLDTLCQELATLSPSKLIAAVGPEGDERMASSLRQADFRRAEIRSLQVNLQEELDFVVYAMYGLSAEDLADRRCLAPPGLDAGGRPFELISASNQDNFPLLDKTVLTWPSEVRELWQARRSAIENTPELKVIEDPHYKRRWIGRQGLFNHAREADDTAAALRRCLLSRLESSDSWSAVELTSVSRIADHVRRDAQFMNVAEHYRGRADFDVAPLVAELVESDAVPFLPVLRYRPNGLRKRAAWERTWDVQRREDGNEEVGEIPVPPRYISSDFLNSTFWSLRGKLDVPKERFISYPHAERDSDHTTVVGWAGWDHLQQAGALAVYYVRMKEQDGWAARRLQPLLAGLLELIPWLKQWHNELDPAYGIGMGDYFGGFVDEEARALGFTLDDIRAWQPPAVNTRRRRRASV